MNRLLKSPATNAVCISVFTAFYALIFLMTSKSIAFETGLHDTGAISFWPDWSRFLADGHHRYIAYALIAVTLLVVALLMIRRRPYDEYHASILTHCLSVAVVLTLIAIAIFYLVIINEPTGIIEKFTLFIVIHWTTVVLSNLAYVLLCRWR